MADHWIKKYQYTAQCSIESPFERQSKGRNISFTEPEKTSSEASFMWCDSEDLSIISDMYQIKIKVITVNRADGNPTENRILPDSELKEFAELRDVELGELILLHEDDVHFNLIISKNNNLAISGNLSSRKDENILEEKDSVRDIEKELKLCKEGKKKIENEYLRCEKELRQKTEEFEKLKVELDNLKELIKLRKQIEEDNLEEIIEISEMKKKGFERVTPQFEAIQKDIKCDVCGYKEQSRNKLEEHKQAKHTIEEVGNETGSDECDKKRACQDMIIEHKDDKHRTENDDINIDVEFNCHECDFQGTEKSQLEKHINWKHTLAKCDVCEFKGGNRIILEKHKKLVHERKVLDECKTCGQLDNKKSQVKEHNSNSQPTLEEVICRICGEQFMEKRNFMLHRKAKHIESVAVCKNSVEGKCVFSSEICFWKHKPDNMNINSFECFICTETFQSKDSMMKLYNRT